MACNNRFGCGQDEFLGPPPNDVFYKLEQCELGIFNRSAWDLMWDLKVLYDLIDKLDKKSPRRLKLLRGTNNILNHIDALDENTYKKGRELASKLLYGKYDKNNDSKYNDNDEDDEDRHTVYAVGNCHIDTAWLWPYGETRRKVIRSWASQIQLMELYGSELNYNFTASQAVQYSWLLNDCPELFNRLKKLSDKSFHIVGGSWVEMDGNIPSGEAFVRQFLIGLYMFINLPF